MKDFVGKKNIHNKDFIFYSKRKLKPRETCVHYIKELCEHGRLVMLNETYTIIAYSLAITSFKCNES